MSRSQIILRFHFLLCNAADMVLLPSPNPKMPRFNISQWLWLVSMICMNGFEEYPYFSRPGSFDAFLVFFHQLVPFVHPWIIGRCSGIQFIQAFPFGNTDDEHQLPIVFK